MGLSTTYTKTETDFLIQQLEKKSEALYTDDTLATDIIKRVDINTGENVNYREVTTWHDGTPMTDIKSDGVIYIKKNNKYYKRQFEGAVNVKWFGAKGDGVSDDTSAFIDAKNLADRFGGGVIILPEGTYKLKDFVIDKPRIIFNGVQDLSGYGSVEKSSVNIISPNDAIFSVRLKGGATSLDAAYSGFKNVLFGGGSEYGIVIDCGATVLENNVIKGYDYGCALIAAANSNIFSKNLFLENKKVGFGWSEVNSVAFLHPKITDVSPISSTKIIWENNKCRQNGYGAIIRESVNTIFRESIFESNKQAGLYILRANNSSVYNNVFQNCWFENNYDNSYSNDWDNHTFDGNSFFKLSETETQPYEASKQLGYQVVLDSQTRNNSGGSATNTRFDFCEINPVYNSNQKAIKVISTYNAEFNFCGFTGNTNGRFSVDADTVFGVVIRKPYGNVDNLLESNFNGILTLSAPNGKEFNRKGATAAPIYFPEIASNDTRVADPNILHDYKQISFDANFDTATPNIFTIADKAATITKIGNLVRVEARATVTVKNILNYDEVFYIALPYPAITTGNLVGSVWVKPTGSTPTTGTLNFNEGFLFTNAVVSVMSTKPIFKNLAVGETYQIAYSLTYNAAE